MTAGHDELAASRRRARGPAARAARRRSPGSPTTTAGPGRPAGPSSSARSTPTAGSACGENPVRLLQEAAPERARARRAPTPALLARAAARRGARRAPTSRARAADALATPSARSRTSAPSSASTRSLPIYSGGLGALAGDILKEASDRALPFVAVGLLYRHGYFRQRIDAGGWQHEYWVDTDPERLPAALVTGDDGEPLTVTVPVGDDAGHRADLARRRRPRAALPARHRAAGERRTPRAGSPSRLYVGDAGRAARAVRAARRRRRARARARSGSSPASCTSTRATRRSSRSSSRARARRHGSLDAALEAVRTRTIFTTHTPVPAGNDTYPAAPGRRDARAARRRRSASTPTRSSASAARTPTTRREPFGVTPVRAAHEPRRQRRQPPPRRGRARDVAATCGPTARSTTCRSPTSPTACTSRPGSAGRCGELLDRHLGDGWLDARRPTPRRGRRVDDIPDEELWAVRSAAARRARRLRARPQRARPARARRAARLRRGRRATRSTPTC